MKKSYLKYSDERNKYFSIKTEIDIRKKIVRKIPIYQEGKEHINNVYVAQEKLKKFYPDVEICKAWLKGDAICFEFVEGESLIDKYNQCLQEQNKKEYEKLLLFHKDIILGSVDNLCVFEGSSSFLEWFGEKEPYVGTDGLRYSNFDAIASNIIIRNGQPVFIDYEWTMDFQMPKDLVIYHCIYDAYLHNQEFEKFYPIAKVMELLDIYTDVKILEESYRKFFEHVICDTMGHSYAKDKYTCLKNIRTLEFILSEWEQCANNWKLATESNCQKDEEIKEIRKEWEECAINWKVAVETNHQKDEEIKEIRKEWEECAKNWKAAIETNYQKDEEIKNICKEWEECVENWKAAIEANNQKDEEIYVLKNKYSELEKQYNAVVNSKVWQANLKIRNVFGK